MSNDTGKMVGILAQFDSAGDLLKAAKTIHKAGFTKFDCHSPFPVHGMDQAMGMKRSILGWIVGLAAIIGTSSGLLLQWWTSAVEYPLVISGKPLFSYQAFVPITFGVGVLFSAFAAVIGMLALNGLPRLHHPVFYSDNFAQVTNNKFFVSIEADDEKFSESACTELLNSLDAKSIELLRENEA